MKVYSIFCSIDGEVNAYYQGRLAVFVRLAGCNLSCKWCDTVYAQESESGSEMSITEIVGEIKSYNNVNKVSITGGEPLLQEVDLRILINELVKADYYVTIETNGSIGIPQTYPHNVKFVVDYKLPSSGMERKMITKAYVGLKSGDFIKFVIQDKQDFEQAFYIMRRFDYLRGIGVQFAFSPTLSSLKDAHKAAELLCWMKETPLPGMILNVQLHKIIDFNESK